MVDTARVQQTPARERDAPESLCHQTPNDQGFGRLANILQTHGRYGGRHRRISTCLACHRDGSGRGRHPRAECLAVLRVSEPTTR